ncbi:MAG: universal stress protein [Gemmatimonadales bacterium]|nr:MAG: universal stress protein [Gemmatimonadales bacterium]
MARRPAPCPDRHSVTGSYTMIHRILVPLDGSVRAEAVLPHVMAVANAFNSRVDLLHVLPAAAVGDRHRPSDPMPCRLARANRARYLESRAEVLRGFGLDVETRIIEGGPAEVIVDLADRGEYDLVALTPHGVGQSTQLAIGCTAVAVLLNVRCSILLVAGYSPESEEAKTIPITYGGILSPVDCSPRSDWSLKVASDLALGSGAHLQVIHVLDSPEVVSRMPRPGATRQLVESIIRANRTEAEEYLRSATRRLVETGVSMETQVLSGSTGGPAESVRSKAEGDGVDLVVLSAHGRGGAPAWPLGGVAMKLLLGIDRPVLVLQDVTAARTAWPRPAQESNRIRTHDSTLTGPFRAMR